MGRRRHRLRDFVWRSDFFPRKLSFTKEGKAVVAISIGLGIAAVNTGNNLLYLVFGISLALIVISGVLSEANLRGVTADPMGAVHPMAGRPSSTVLTVRSARRRFPAFSIEAWPLIDTCDARPARILDLRPGASAEAACVLDFPRRGEYPLRGVAVTTGFPFSFFRKSLVLPATGTVKVHPRLRAPERSDLPAGLEGEDESRPVPGRGVEFYGVRDFRQGDNPRRVLHRLSASRITPVVRENEQTGIRAAWVALVNVAPQGADGEARVEEAVERAAGLAAHLVGEGRVVGLATASGSVPPGTGPAQARRILDFLATVPVLPAGQAGAEDRVRGACRALPGARVSWVRP
jgi:uncharacterized protein (DUF58 family)